MSDKPSNCESCGRPAGLEAHHVAMGFREATDALPEPWKLKAWICPLCHRAIHAMQAEHQRAMGLAIIERAGRGLNLELFWKVTKRIWPSLEIVNLWRAILRAGR